jgi:dimethylhistidine N-methyltransferase
LPISTDKSFDVVDLISNTAPSNSPDFALTVLEGLTKKEKRLPSWLIFDDVGSRIFEEITGLEHYHPTVSEFDIFRTQKQTIAELLPEEPFQIIELGSGDARKSKILLDYLVKNKNKFHYSPLDISSGAIKNLVASLASKYEGTSLTVTGVVAYYFQGLEWLLKKYSGKKIVFFLGSTIGNYDLPGAEVFLRSLWNSLNAGDLTLIGFDLLKHPKVLYQAYNDPKGVFEKFNLHLLKRINQQLGANFNTEFFVQQGNFNWRTRAVESYLYSTRDQAVRIEKLNREFPFKNGEGMQTEHSYKYTIEEIENLARNNGFEIIKHLFDSNRHYVDSIWKVDKDY